MAPISISSTPSPTFFSCEHWVLTSCLSRFERSRQGSRLRISILSVKWQLIKWILGTSKWLSLKVLVLTSPMPRHIVPVIISWFQQMLSMVSSAPTNRDDFLWWQNHEGSVHLNAGPLPVQGSYLVLRSDRMTCVEQNTKILWRFKACPRSYKTRGPGP